MGIGSLWHWIIVLLIVLVRVVAVDGAIVIVNGLARIGARRESAVITLTCIWYDPACVERYVTETPELFMV